MSEKTVVVGLSGGVDSSVAALLLKRQGWKVIGLFMKNWEDDDSEEYCSSRQDLVDVMSVADCIGIDVEVVNFAAEYRERVFAEFLREYQAGRTPNPDMLCNSEIKFKAFLDHAMKMGADRIATGHYAGVREFDGKFQLLKAEDGTKDQSYFLYRLNQAQLSKTLFPLAGIYKREVRKIAEAEGLHVAAKRTRLASASSASGRSRTFFPATCRRNRAKSAASTTARCLASTMVSCTTRSASARACISAA
jgi:tRNA-specific 2-thiouridylase